MAADASAADGALRAGFEGTEQLITVLFVDLRRSSLLARAKMPYDFLYILNQFFYEMTKALAATNGHYAHFAGDGMMALYGLNAKDPATGAADALRGAREMLACMDQLNSRLRGDLLQPLRIGIGIHFGEAIVGAMGPPSAQIISTIGQVVNTCARLEQLRFAGLKDIQPPGAKRVVIIAFINAHLRASHTLEVRFVIAKLILRPASHVLRSACKEGSQETE
jgi:adenylate cyclase